MPFDLVINLDGSSNPIENYLLTDGEAGVAGEVYVQTSGRLTKCGATATPEFIGLRTQALEASSVTPYPVQRITETDVFKTTSTATVAASLLGAKVTLHTTGLQVTATTTSGVATIVSTDGAATTSNVNVMFRR